MQIKASVLGIALATLALACGGEGNDGDGGSGGTGGTGTSTVIGTVSTRDLGAARVSGATVEVFGTQLSATTNDDGEFMLRNVPNGDVFFVSQADGNWGTVDYYYVPQETSGEIIDLGVVPDSVMSSIAQALGRSLSAADGIVDVSFFPFAQGVPGAQGGETASISAASDPPFTFDLDGNPLAQAGVIADEEGYGELIYTSIMTADGPITADVMGVDGVTSCDIAETPGITYPILEKSITFVYASCEPAR
jgi:hypothetical protein